MTTSDLRSDPDFRRDWSAIFQMPAFQQALASISADNEAQDVPFGAGQLDIARAYERQRAVSSVLKQMAELTQPLPPEIPEPLMNFGTSHSVEDFDQP